MPVLISEASLCLTPSTASPRGEVDPPQMKKQTQTQTLQISPKGEEVPHRNSDSPIPLQVATSNSPQKRRSSPSWRKRQKRTVSTLR